MKKNITNIKLIISFLLLVTLLGLFFYFFNFLKIKNNQISTIIATLRAKETEKENIDVLKKKMAELGDVEKKIGDHIVDTASIDLFVEYLENIGINNNVNLIVKSVEVPKTEKNKILLNLEMNGSFSNITKTIALLENSPYNMMINSTYLNKDSTQFSQLNNTSNDTKIIPVAVPSSWQANLTISVLSL